MNSCLSNLSPIDQSRLLELRVLVLNNHGLGCLTGGDSAGALVYFREAVELIADGNDHQYWLLMPVHFNLALLSLRDGKMDESAKTWLSIRGHLDTWELAKRGDAGALSKLRESHLMAMNRHGMLLAKQHMTGAFSTLSYQKNVIEWVAPAIREEKWQEDSIRINGVEAVQISTMDFVILKYALSIAEKRSNNRRSMGSAGY